MTYSNWFSLLQFDKEKRVKGLSKGFKSSCLGSPIDIFSGLPRRPRRYSDFRRNNTPCVQLPVALRCSRWSCCQSCTSRMWHLSSHRVVQRPPNALRPWWQRWKSWASATAPIPVLARLCARRARPSPTSHASTASSSKPNWPTKLVYTFRKGFKHGVRQTICLPDFFCCYNYTCPN